MQFSDFTFISKKEIFTFGDYGLTIYHSKEKIVECKLYYGDYFVSRTLPDSLTNPLDNLEEIFNQLLTELTLKMSIQTVH